MYFEYRLNASFLFPFSLVCIGISRRIYIKTWTKLKSLIAQQ
jgi:hypothetical protein